MTSFFRLFISCGTHSGGGGGIGSAGGGGSNSGGSPLYDISYGFSWWNALGGLCILLSLYVLIFTEIFNENSYIYNHHTIYDMVSLNIILLTVSVIPLFFSDFYKKSFLSKNRIEMTYFNFGQSIIVLGLLWLVAPIAFKLEYVSVPSGFCAFVFVFFFAVFFCFVFLFCFFVWLFCFCFCCGCMCVFFFVCFDLCCFVVSKRGSGVGILSYGWYVLVLF